MNVKPIPDPFPGEHFVRTEPKLKPLVSDAGWRRRANLFTNRALSADALAVEQAEHSGRLATLGQTLFPGVVEGLEVRLEVIENQYHLIFSAGAGLAASGEDVILRRSVRVPLKRIPVYSPDSDPAPFDMAALAAQLDNPNTPPTLPRAAILVLVPTVTQSEPPASGSDPSEVDEEAYAYEDIRLLEGVTPIFQAWPSWWHMPKDLPQDVGPSRIRLRNLLANMVFEAERRRRPGKLAPWEQHGVPIALMAFDGGNPLFLDRHAVVRTGGAPRSRTPLIRPRGNPLLWQSRMLQFSEQLADLGRAPVLDETAMEWFRRLPPLGILPPDAVDYQQWSRRFFPDNFLLEAMPVPVEQLDTLAQASGPLATLNSKAPERVRVLVPVPGSVFEPRLLMTELLDPAFIDALDEGFRRLGLHLKKREVVRERLTVLRDALDGPVADRFPAKDPLADPEEAQYIPATLPADSPEPDFGTQGDTVPAIDKLMETRLLPRWEPVIDSISAKIPDEEWSPNNGRGNEFAGQLTSEPIVVSQGGTVHVVARGPYWTLWHRAFDGAKWTHVNSTMASAGRGAILRSRSVPTVTLQPNGRLNVVYIDPNGWLRYTFINTRAAVWNWSTPTYLVSGTESAPAAVYSLEGRTEVFFLRNDGRALWHTALTSVSLTEVQRTNPTFLGQSFRGQPVAVVAGKKQIHIFGIGFEGELWNGIFNGSTVEKWFRIAKTPRKWVSACTASDGRVHVLSVDPNGQLFHSFYDPTKEWSSEKEVTNGLSLVPSIVAGENGRLDVLARGVDGLVRQASYEKGTWSEWTPLSGENSLMAPALVRRGNLLDALIRGHDNLLWRRAVLDRSHDLLKRDGLREMADDLAARVQQLDESVDAAFLRVQADSRRVRQLMMGIATASQIAVSPVLADVTQTVTRQAKQVEVASYLKRTRRVVDWTGQQDPDTPPIMGALRLPPVINTLYSALDTKRELLGRVLDMVAQTDLDVSGVELANVRLPPWRRDKEAPDVTLTQDGVGGAVGVGGVKSITRDRNSKVPLTELVRINAADRAVLFDKLFLRQSDIQAGSDELTYFSEAVAQLEDVVAVLRGLENRVADYRRTLTEAGQVITDLQAYSTQGDKRLAELAAEIAEARQDIGVARALLAEERSRLEVINTRREKVLKEHVRFLVFQRPREVDVDVDTPVRALDTGIVESVLPAALANTRAAPPELWSLVQLFKDAPLQWLTRGTLLLRQLDRLELIQQILADAKLRAATRPVPLALPVYNRAITPIGLGLSAAYAAQSLVLSRIRTSIAALELSLYYGRSWSELVQLALPVTSLGELMEAGHGRSDVARQAAKELEDLSKVATHLYTLFGQVAPTLRLQWAQEYSQYDATIDLRSLARLGRWNEVDLELRRDLQELVDWLFNRVSSTEGEARSLINDLVRSALLLASHAPVGEIVSGHLPKPTPAKVGTVLELAVEPIRIRVGMHVLIASGEHTVQAVVEDLGTGIARARVFSATATTVNLAEKAVAKFSEPELPRSLLPMPAATFTLR